MIRTLIANMVFFCIISMATSMVGIEGDRGELKKPEKYEAPKDAAEAKKAWDDAERERKVAEDEKEKRQEDLKKTIKALNRKDLSAAERQRLNIQFEFDSREVGQADIVKKDWQARQEELLKNDLVKQYTASLGQLLEPTEQLPSALQRFLNQIRIWLKTNIQLPFNTWLGDVNKVIEIRRELAQLYTEFGKQGLLERARNNKELAAVLDNLDDKIGTHLAALQDYKDALTRGTVSETERAALRQEVNQLIVDLMVLDKELEDRKVDSKIRETINKEIDATLEALGISAFDRRALEERAGIPQKAPTTIEGIERLTDDIRIGFSDIPDIIKDDPVNFIANEKYQTFMRNLALLERVDVAKITDPAAQVLVTYVIRNAYKTLNDDIYRAVSNLQIPAPDRLVLLDRWLELNPKYQEVEDTYQKFFDKYVAQEGRVPTSQEIGVQPPLAKGTADNVKKQLATLIKDIDVQKNITFPTRMKEEYQKLIKEVTNWNNLIDASAVSEETLNARQAIYDSYRQLLQSINDASLKLKENANDEIPLVTAAVILNISDRMNAAEYALESDRSALVIIKEGLEPELVKEAKRPEDTDALAVSSAQTMAQMFSLAEIERLLSNPNIPAGGKKLLYQAQQMRIELDKQEYAVQRGALQREVLARIKLEPQLRPVAERGEIVRPPTVQQQLENEISKVILKRAQTKEPLSPKEWWESYKQTGIEK